MLHYFHDIDEFMRIMHSLLKNGGKMICSDFHPFTKIADILQFGQSVSNYFFRKYLKEKWLMPVFLKKKSGRKCPSAVTGSIRSAKLSIQL